MPRATVIRRVDGVMVKEEPAPGRWYAAMFERIEQGDIYTQAEDVGQYIGGGSFDDEGSDVTQGMLAAEYLQLQV